jgi:hypothetical protein
VRALSGGARTRVVFGRQTNKERQQVAQETAEHSDGLLQPGVHEKLNRLRLSLRARLAAEGLAWLLMALVAAVFATLAMDYLLHLLRLDDYPQRAVVVALSLTAVACVAWQQLLAPLLVPMKPEALGLLVERYYGQLGDRLISAIQFSHAGTAEGISRAMIAKTAADAAVIAQPLDFRKLVERRRMRQMLMVAACAVALLAGFCFWQRDLMGLWFQRNVLFANAPWPQKTYLEVRGGPDFAVLRGDDLSIEVAVREGSVAPSHIVLRRLYPSVGRPTEDQVEQAPGSPGRYVKVVRGVNEPFEFYVTGGDDQTDKLTPHKVRVVDPPTLREVVFTVEYPGYTNFEPRRLSSAGEVLAVPYGGRLRVEATANKALAAAEIHVDGSKVWPEEAPAGDSLRPLASRNLVAQFALPSENELVTKMLKFVLRDTEGYSNRGAQVFSVQILPDDPPSVQIARIGGLSDIHSVTPNARMPLLITARDSYGVGLLELSDRHEAIVAQAARQLKLSAAEIRQRYRLPAAKVVVDDKSSVLISEPLLELLENGIQTRLDHTHKLHLQGKVKPGQSIRILATAEDRRTRELKGPGVGQSKPLDFDVVEVEVMQDKLLGIQKKAADDFASAIQLQATAYAKCAAAADSEAFTKGPVTAAVRAGLAASARGQHAVGDSCGQAADRFQGILEESQYNGIGEANEYAAMTQGIVLPLRALVGRCGAAAAELNRIVSETEHAAGAKDKKLADAVSAAAAEQRAILDEMKAVSRRMEKLRSLQAMVDKVQRLIRWLEELHKEIEQQREAGLEGIFRPTTREAPPGGQR